MSDSVIWFRGVPWAAQALTAAQAEDDPGLVEVVTEIAREIRHVRHDRPEPGAKIRAERAGWVAVLSGDLVVVGYGKAGAVSPSASDAPDGPTHVGSGESPRESRKKGRGPSSFKELQRWLAEEGFMVQTKGVNHPVVYNSAGARLVTLPLTPSDPRSVKNSVAICRRVLGIELRKPR